MDTNTFLISFTDAILTILLLPLQVLFIPIDYLLEQIPGIGVIPTSITAIVQFVGSVPSLLVNLLGIQPIIWNALFLTFILFITLSPSIQVIKRVYAWIRP